LVVARRSEQPGDGGAYFAGTDHNDILHACSGSPSERKPTKQKSTCPPRNSPRHSHQHLAKVLTLQHTEERSGIERREPSRCQRASYSTGGLP
jgi:hypothetical protein